LSRAAIPDGVGSLGGPGSSAVLVGLLGSLGIGAAFGGFFGCGKHASETARASNAETRPAGLEGDERIAFLLAPCTRPDPFLADTSDLLPVLVSKLEKGQLDPMRGAKEQLVALGDAALPELRRFCARVRADPTLSIPYLNALAVVSAMETHAGRDLLAAGLEHPQDTIRIQAADGLSRHAAAEDYDTLATLAAVASPDVLRAVGPALATADRARYEDAYAAALGTPAASGPLWEGAAKRLADTKRPEILAKFKEAYPRADGPTRAFLAAAVAASGDEAALASLRGNLKDENSTTRKLAIQALDRIGLVAEAAPLLSEDRDETVRGMVAQAIAALPPTVQTAAWLHKGMLDRAKNVRQICLTALASRGDASARETGLSMFEGGRVDFEQAMTALRDAWTKDPEFSARTFELLVRLRTGEAGGLRVDAPSVDRAIAQLPIVDATRFLYDAAKTTREEIDGYPAHRWFLIQAANTGAGGRAWLRDRWSEESDPTWRVDIAVACAADRDESSLEFLLKVVDDERTTPLEILHAANLLVHQGPASVVAPRLKRVALRIDDARVRPALNCMLWQWYGEGP
jgi:hypothetical protein